MSTDYKSVTWDDFYAARLPDPDLREGGTAYALTSLRQQFHQAGAEVIGGFVKWGMPLIKDLVAFSFFSDCMKAAKDSEKAMHAVRRPLDTVDWQFVENLLSDGAEKYKEYMRTVSKDAHQFKNFLDGLEYGMAGKLPGVEKPGDLYAAIMRAPDAS